MADIIQAPQEEYKSAFEVNRDNVEYTTILNVLPLLTPLPS